MGQRNRAQTIPAQRFAGPTIDEWDDDITEEVPVIEYDTTDHVATCDRPIPLCYTCSNHFNLKEY